jgi:parallel beta-helix repeat protein
MFINNTISTDGRGAHLSGIDLRKTGGVASPENNYLSGNDVSGYQYGLDTWNGIMNFTVDGDRYHDNGYGIWLQGIGSAELMPTISNSEIYNNSHGVYLTSSSYANISDTNFTNNPGTEGGGGSGIHVEGGSTAYVTNGRFIDNGEYGIYDVILDHVYWTINSNTLCKNNDVRINGNITFDGGILEAINCSLSMGGSAALELSGNLSSLQLAQASIVANISSDEIDFEDTDSAITLMLGEDVTTTIMISSVIPTTTPSAVLEALKGIEITVDNATEGNLTWALIKIFYDEAELTAANIDESTLKIYYYNKTAADWQLEPNQGVDTVNNYVWANVTHFSLFGAFGTAPIAAAAVTTTKGGGCLTNWTCSEWGKCTKGTQTRTCQKIREVCYAGAKPEETQACSVEGIAGAGAEEQEKTFVILTSKSWWILVSVIAAISIVVLIILKLSKILRYRRYF